MNLPTPRQPIQVLHPITRLIVGGAQENTMYTAALLDKQRFHVELLSGPQTGSEGSLIEEVKQRGIPLTIFPDLLRQVSPLHDLKALWKMKRFIQSGSYTIVHTHSSKAGILGRLAARLAKTPLIVHTVHGWSFHDYMSPVTRWIYILLERWIARFSDALVVVTERDIEKGLQAGIGRREQYRRIRSAIPLDEFDPRLVDRTGSSPGAGSPRGCSGHRQRWAFFNPEESVGLGARRRSGRASLSAGAFPAGGRWPACASRLNRLSSKPASPSGPP